MTKKIEMKLASEIVIKAYREDGKPFVEINAGDNESMVAIKLPADEAGNLHKVLADALNSFYATTEDSNAIRNL